MNGPLPPCTPLAGAACLLLVLSRACPAASAQGATGTPSPAADPHTIALWLFDEPPYLNMTLTDAGPHQYDLRLLEPGRLVAGRFGRCLARRHGASGQAVCFAEERTHYANDSTEPLKSRMSVPPARLLSCLAEGDWTWEFWLRMRQKPDPGACLIDAGQWDLYCALAEKPDGLEVVSAGQGIDVITPLEWDRLGDRRWHHLALVWSRETRELRCFLNGRPQGDVTAAPTAAWRRPARDQHLPGLVGRIFGDQDLTRSASTEVMPLIDFDLGRSRGSAWSERWRGWLRSPITGEVAFRAEADTGLRFILDGQTVIDGWGPDAPRTGSMILVEGERYPVVLEYSHVGDSARLSLRWSWPGGREQVVPPDALSHTPADRGAAPHAYRFDLALLSDQNGDHACDALIDEMRVSDVARYRAPFTPPGTLSRNHGPHAPAAATPTGPPLLFASGAPRGVVDLGSRKHVFIDDALLDRSDGLAIRQCPPLRIEPTEIGFGLGDATVLDCDGHIRLYHGGWLGSYRLATSEDGLRFVRPDLGIAEWGGQTEDMGGNAIFRLPGQASFFVDGNPAALADERFKCTAFIMTRGLYALTSADGIHWRRNETIMLPFDCGGGVETFWDDQRGSYVCHIRHEGHYARTGDNQRLAARAETREFLRPWPFDPDPHPVPRRAFTLPALWHELPTPFVPDATGQVYRTRALKYPWAPDTYLAFVWRYDTERETRQTELAVSRDGENWRFFGVTPAYLPTGIPFGDGQQSQASLACFGLVRRGAEIWQYAELNSAGHSAGQEAVVRVVQRLDGFTCLQAGDREGWAVTRPLTFEGDTLALNVRAEGKVRVGLLDRAGTPIPSFGPGDCVPLHADGVRELVHWTGGSLTKLAGRPVRLRFEMRNASLFALQFVRSGRE